MSAEVERSVITAVYITGACSCAASCTWHSPDAAIQGEKVRHLLRQPLLEYCLQRLTLVICMLGNALAGITATFEEVNQKPVGWFSSSQAPSLPPTMRERAVSANLLRGLPTANLFGKLVSNEHQADLQKACSFALYELRHTAGGSCQFLPLDTRVLNIGQGKIQSTYRSVAPIMSALPQFSLQNSGYSGLQAPAIAATGSNVQQLTDDSVMSQLDDLNRLCGRLIDQIDALAEGQTQ